VQLVIPFVKMPKLPSSLCNSTVVSLVYFLVVFVYFLVIFCMFPCNPCVFPCSFHHHLAMQTKSHMKSRSCSHIICVIICVILCPVCSSDAMSIPSRRVPHLPTSVTLKHQLYQRANTHTHTYSHTYSHTHTLSHTHILTHNAHTHTHTHAHTHTHTHTYTHILTHTYSHTHTHTHAHTHTHTRTHIYTHTHTHILTHCCTFPTCSPSAMSLPFQWMPTFCISGALLPLFSLRVQNDYCSAVWATLQTSGVLIPAFLKSTIGPVLCGQAP